MALAGINVEEFERNLVVERFESVFANLDGELTIWDQNHGSGSVGESEHALSLELLLLELVNYRKCVAKCFTSSGLRCVESTLASDKVRDRQLLNW